MREDKEVVPHLELYIDGSALRSKPKRPLFHYFRSFQNKSRLLQSYPLFD